MNEQKKMDAILEAIPWRCFHCDFITSDRAEAEAHFGERDDAGEFTPICKWWANMDETERIATLQDTIREWKSEQDDNGNLREQVEDLEGRVENQLSEIHSYAPFRKCESIHDIFCLYDSMEGRALAAEEREKVNN